MPASAFADASPRAAAPARRLAHVVVHDSLAEVRSDWEHLLAVAPASAYQTPAWLGPWLDTLGSALQPRFVVGADAFGPVALLPLGLARHGGLGVARFLGGRDSNWGLGLFHPEVTWDAATLRHLLSEAARLGGIDLLWLANQPALFAGRTNPLALLPGRPSPALQHETTLGPHVEAVLARNLSARARKHIRQKEAKLAGLGPVVHEVARDAATAERIVAALLAQRAARFGPLAQEAALRAFLLTAAAPRPGAEPSVVLHGLRCGDTITAAFAGAPHEGRLSGMLVSFADDPAWARFSPGELLIARILAAQGQAGAAYLDLGIGEARYKSGFCPTAVPLFDTVLGMTLRGRIAARGLVAALAAKRRIKQAPRLWVVIERWRSRLRGLSGRFAARR